ncbi:MAG: HEAT repeat domain-containing protein [Phycisphaerales bacterium]
MQRSVVTAMVFAASVGGLLGVMACASGCQSRGKQAQQSTSILQVFAPPTPEEASRWAIDPFNADKRARGTLLLANAPWGGEDVYVRLYREQIKDTYRDPKKDPDPLVRAVAVRALAMHGSPDDVPAILELLKSDEKYLRWECARALQRLHNPVAVKPLTDRLNAKNEAEASVREASASALGQYAERASFDALVAALYDRDLAVSSAARRSLATITGRDLGEDVRPWVAFSKESADVFAGRKTYEYPIFQRDPDWLEYIVPMLAPPNEKPGVPVGLPAASASASAGRGNGSAEPTIRSEDSAHRRRGLRRPIKAP